MDHPDHLATMALLPRGELLPYKGDFYLWSYVPSMAAAIIFLIIFFVLSVAHTWKMCRQRLWFCIPFVVGGYLEAVGFIGRITAHDATDQLMPYVIQSVFLLVPPSLFAASIYMTLGRVITSLGPQGESCSIIRVRWLTTIFVVGDVFAFLIQSSGAGYMAAGDDPKIGEGIVIAGLVVQILFFGVFVTSAVVFQFRYSPYAGSGNVPAHTSTDSTGSHRGRQSWEKVLMMLYATSALILARCIFRIIEYVMGADAYPLKNEWTLYVFDALLMAIVMAIFYVWYPSDVPSRKRVCSATDNITLSEEANHGKSNNSSDHAS